MKTTIDIAEDLLLQSKEVARKEHITLRALVEQGLQQVLAKRHKQSEPFRLRMVKERGGGFRPGFEEAGWEAIRDEIYKGHGS